MSELILQMKKNKAYLLIAILGILISVLVLYFSYPSFQNGFTSEKSVLLIFTLIVLIVFVELFYHFAVVKRSKLEYLFLITTLSLGMIYFVFFPPITVADEKAHFMLPYYYSQKLLFQPGESVDHNMLFRDCDQIFFDNMKINGSYQYISELYHNYPDFYVGKQELFESAQTVRGTSGNIVIYFPVVFGMFLAKLFGLGIVPLLILAKLMNFAAFITLTFLGIRKMPFGKGFLLLTATLPIVNLFATSLSYDPINNAIAFAFIGYAVFFLYTEEEKTKKDMLLLTIFTILLAFTKGGLYMILSGVLLLGFRSAKGMLKKENFWIWRAWILELSAYALAMISNRYLFTTANVLSADHFERLEKAGRYSLSDCFTQPIMTLKIMILTIFRYADDWIFEMIGAKLSWVSVPLPKLLMILIAIALFLTLFCNQPEKLIITGKQKLWVIVIGTMILVGVELIMLLAEPLDGIYIHGVQGRYFHALLPLLYLCFVGKLKIKKESYFRWLLMSCNVLFAAAALIASVTILKS